MAHATLAVAYRVVADTRRPRRTRRGRPAKPDPPPAAPGYRLVAEVIALPAVAADNGGTVPATTVSTTGGSEAEIRAAYQEQHTTVEPGLRWIKTPAAISSVWREKPARLAALAVLTGMGLLV